MKKQNHKNKNRQIGSKKTDKKSEAPSLSEMRAYLAKMTLDDFKKELNLLMKSDNRENLNFLFYYIILFRDLENIQNYLNDETVPIEVLEHLFMFTYGYCTIHGYSAESIFDNVMSFISNERLLKLLLESKYIKKDKFFKFSLLARLDVHTLNKYFRKQKNIIDIISAFYRLPENVMKSIIVRNHKLFEYMMMMLMVDTDLNNEAKVFVNKYKKITDQFTAMNDIIMNYRTTVNLDKEEKLPFNKRDMKRISYLVNIIRSMQDMDIAMEFFSDEKVFVDDYERQLVVALVSDPFLKDTFQDEK